MTLMENLLPVMGLAPAADAFTGTKYSDVVNLKNYGRVVFLVQIGVGTTGRSTFTVEACDDVVPTNVSAIAFKYRELTSAGSSSAWGALTSVASTGYNPAAGSNRMLAIEVRANELPTGYGCVRVKAVEGTDDPVAGAILAILAEPKQSGDSMPACLV